MEIGRDQNDRQVALLCFADFLSISGDPGGMTDSSEILFEIPFHLNGYTILEEVLFLGNQLGRKIADALIRVPAVRGTTKIHFGIEKSVTTFFAQTRGVIFKKLYHSPTFGAFGLKDGPRLPIAAVLSRAFHGISSAD
jgi:hypothetical protein